MNKVVFRSESDRESAKENGVESIWYTVVNDPNKSEQLANVNPWNHDAALIKKKLYLIDDCVVSIRPARSEDRIGRSNDFNKGYYFIEIMNQDESIKFISYKVYMWEDALQYISWFKGLSFTAALKVWKVKKL